MEKLQAFDKYPDTKLVSVLLSGEKTPNQLLIQHDMSIAQACQASNGSVANVDDGTEITIDGETISLSRRAGELLSLIPHAANGPDKAISNCAGYRFIAFRTASSNFRMMKGTIVRDSKRGLYVEEIPENTQIVSTDSISVAVFDGINAGALGVKNDPDGSDGLDGFYVWAKVGIVKAQMRLDHALSLLKIAGKPADAYGDHLLGAVLVVTRKARDWKWRLVYGVDENGQIEDRTAASIDHVTPKSQGGADRLVNMQLMMKGKNSEKGSANVRVYPDPRASLHVLSLLDKGIRGAVSRGDLERSDACSIMELLGMEYAACKSASDELRKMHNATAKAAEKKENALAEYIKAEVKGGATDVNQAQQAPGAQGEARPGSAEGSRAQSQPARRRRRRSSGSTGTQRAQGGHEKQARG